MSEAKPSASKKHDTSRFTRVHLVLEHGIRLHPRLVLARPGLLNQPQLGPRRVERRKDLVLKKPSRQTLGSLTPNKGPPTQRRSVTRLKTRGCILPGQPAGKNRPIRGHFHFLIPRRSPYKIIKISCPSQSSARRCNKRMKFRPGQGKYARPFSVSSHKVTLPKQGLDRLTECQLSRSLTSLTARPRLNCRSDPRGSGLVTLG